MSDFATTWTVAHQAPLSMEFSRQESWSGKPFTSTGEPFQPRGWTCVSHIAGRFFGSYVIVISATINPFRTPSGNIYIIMMMTIIDMAPVNIRSVEFNGWLDRPPWRLFLNKNSLWFQDSLCEMLNKLRFRIFRKEVPVFASFLFFPSFLKLRFSWGFVFYWEIQFFHIRVLPLRPQLT